MAKTLFSTVLILCATASAALAQSQPTMEQAQKAYAARDYSQPGIASAQSAADMYGEIAAATADTKEKAKYQVLQAEALYFIGDATNAKDAKIKIHLSGMQIADQAVKALGVDDVRKVDAAKVAALKAALSPEQMILLGDALWNRGIHLGQWGQANGVVQSLSKWPELRDNMQAIIDLGMKDAHEYGAYRTLGRGYNQIPGILGGDNQKAAKYLQAAVDKTKAPNATYSISGSNNTFYATVLKDLGRKDEAKALLAAFIKADPNTLKPNSIPETKKAQEDAADLLAKW